MNKLLFAAALTLSPLAFAGTTLEIDSSHAAAVFTVKHLMVMNVTGRTGTVTGKVDFDEKDPTKSKVEVNIDLKGLDTNEPKRDAHLRGADFFDTDKFPTATFRSTKVEKAGDRLKVTGDLTMRGVTKPVTLDAQVTAPMQNPFNNRLVRAVHATTTINREDWGVAWNRPMANDGLLVGREVALTIDCELREPTPPAKR